MVRALVLWLVLGLVSGAAAQSPEARITATLSQTIDRSATDAAGAEFAFLWATAGYDFSGPWSGATDYSLYAERETTAVQGWSGAYQIDPATLSYPVEVAPFVPELGVYLVRVRCADAPCAAMEGYRLGWNIQTNDRNRLNDANTWEPFDNVVSGIIFAVGDCDTAHEVATQLDALLERQGAAKGPNASREPCDPTLGLVSFRR